jgi:hypothetical protein
VQLDSKKCLPCKEEEHSAITDWEVPPLPLLPACFHPNSTHLPNVPKLGPKRNRSRHGVEDHEMGFFGYPIPDVFRTS